MSRVLLGAGVAIIAAVIALFLVFRPRSKPAEDALPKGAAVSGVAAELTSLLRQGNQLDYHAVYEVQGGSEHGSVRIHLYRKNGLVRQDEVVTDGRQRLETEGFRLRDRMVICRRENAKPWTCVPRPNGARGAKATAEPFVDQILADIAGRDISANDQTIAGRQVRCFSISEKPPDAASELCLSRDGIPIAIRSGPSAMELIQLDREVSDDVFNPPAG